MLTIPVGNHVYENSSQWCRMRRINPNWRRFIVVMIHYPTTILYQSIHILLFISMYSLYKSAIIRLSTGFSPLSLTHIPWVGSSSSYIRYSCPLWTYLIPWISQEYPYYLPLSLRQYHHLTYLQTHQMIPPGHLKCVEAPRPLFVGADVHKAAQPEPQGPTGNFMGTGWAKLDRTLCKVHVCGVNFWETLSKIWHSSSSFWHWKEGSVMPVDAEMAFAEDFQIRRRQPNLFLLSGDTILKEHMIYQQPINSQFYKKPTCVFSAAPNHVYGSPLLCVRFMVYCPNLANWTESFM